MPRAERMQNLARLPVFFALKGKRALVAGGSAGAAWKAELLSAAGARVDVYAPEASEELFAIAAEPPNGPVSIHARGWKVTDFAGTAIAVGACDSEEDAAHFAAAARAAGVPVNVVDRPDFCDFAFGAIVNRSPLVIGISTDGAAPIFAQAIRGRIEELVPAGFARWAEAARRWRGAVKKSSLSFEARRRFWQLFTARAIVSADEAPTNKHFGEFLVEVETEGAGRQSGSITLVETGAAADLLTLRGARALQAADIVVFDKDVPPEILDFARREATKVSVAGTTDDAAPLADVWLQLRTWARSGKRIVYLQRGLMRFQQLAAEIAACGAAGMVVQIVPGVRTATIETQAVAA